MMETCRLLAKTGIAVYLVLSLYVIGTMVTGYQSAFATAIAKKSLRDIDSIDDEVSTKTLGNTTIQTTNTTVQTIKEFPAPDDVYFDRLVEQGSNRSANHQRKFLARKMRISSQFETRVRFQSQPGKFAAVVISDEFAFLHIWKCGGTTVAELVNGEQSHLTDSEIQSRQWVAFVRDPIDRFLSAWAECGFRQFEGTLSFGGFESHSTLNWLDDNYDFRVRAFLHEVQSFTFPEVWQSCHTHAHPQANFMMNQNGHIDHHLTIIGDLHEMRSVLELAHFSKHNDLKKGRDSAKNSVKSEYFPSRRNLLQDQTILELCQFLALDYFLFDFQPPELCIQPGGPLARFV